MLNKGFEEKLEILKFLFNSFQINNKQLKSKINSIKIYSYFLKLLFK